MVNIIDGNGMAGILKEEMKREVNEIIKTGKSAPRLTVILVGEDPASQIYVRNKEKDCKEVGIESEIIKLPSTISQKELNGTIKELNNNRKVSGIIVQLPIPKTLNETEAINLIDPNKDVDGLHPLNMGRLLKGEGPTFVSCTPQGVIEMILSTGVEVKGKEAVVVGRSNIVGKPVALLLLQNHATVTICHSRTRDLAGVCRRADILIAAIGKARMITKDMVKDGAIVIDVGINRIKGKLVGDVDYERVKDKAGFITPVPGGVGPMTRAMLLKNTLKAAKLATTKKS